MFRVATICEGAETAVHCLVYCEKGVVQVTWPTMAATYAL